MSSEMFLKDGSDRYTLFPIKYHDLWDFYKKHEATFWTVEEIRLTDDLVDWKERLNDSERFFIKNVLAFFAASDGIVNENLVVNFYNEIQIPEARQFYTVQMMMESIHSECYSVLIDTYIVNTDEKNHLFNAMETIPAVKKKADWAIKWIEGGSNFKIPKDIIDDLRELKTLIGGQGNYKSIDYILDSQAKQKPLLQRLVAFICVEGIFFSGSFCAIYWLKQRGLMPGLSTANQFISRDENLHCEVAINLAKKFPEKLSESVVHEIFRSAVDIEKEFVTDSLPVSLIGMNCKLMQQYIEYVADRWLVLLGYPKIYNNTNPFDFMEMISVNTKSNFFETNVDQYRRAGVGADTTSREIGFDDDF